MFIVLRARWRTRGGDIAAGMALGLAIAFKPNLALVAALLLALWLIDRRPRVLVRQIGGLARRRCPGGAHRRRRMAVVPTVVRLDETVGELGGQVAYTTRDGNYALTRLAVEGGWPDPSRVLLIGLALLTVGAMVVGARRRRADTSRASVSGEVGPPERTDEDAFQRECLALSAGIAVVLLASPLSWLYYYLLLVPVQLVLLGRIGPGTSPSQVARWILVGISVLLLWFTPLSTVFGLPTNAFPVRRRVGAGHRDPPWHDVVRAGRRVHPVAVADGRGAHRSGRRGRCRLRGWVPAHGSPEWRARSGVSPRRRPSRKPRTEVELGRVGKLAVVLLVAAPMVVTASRCSPRSRIPIPNLNDDAFHLPVHPADGRDAAIRREPARFLGASTRARVPASRSTTSSFPHLVVVLLDRLTLGAVDLFTMFNLVRSPCSSGCRSPSTGRCDGWASPVVASAMAAAASPLFSGAFRYGFEYDSYIWRGFGMFTQAWAMHLSFIALACIYRVVNRGTGYILAIVALSVLLMSHLIYAYMMAITVVLVVIVGRATEHDRPAPGAPRDRRRGGPRRDVLSVAAVHHVAPVPQRHPVPRGLQVRLIRGWPAILGWLFSGDLLDHGRLPVLTALLGARDRGRGRSVGRG